MRINPGLNYISWSDIVSLDLETTGLKGWKDSIDLIALKTDYGEYILEYAHYNENQLNWFFTRLARCHRVLVHNAKFDGGFIFSHTGILLRNLTCTETLAEICENGNQKKLRKKYQKRGAPFSLAMVLERWMDVKHKETKNKKFYQKSFTLGLDYNMLPELRRKQMEYAMEDVRYLRPLYDVLMARIDELKLHTICALEMKLIPILIKVEARGCLIDRQGWETLVPKYWKPELDTIEEKLDEEVKNLLLLFPEKSFPYSLKRTRTTSVQFDIFGNSNSTEIVANDVINYSSPTQLVELFKFMEEEPPVNEAGDPTVGEEALLVYLTEHGDSKLKNFIELLLEYRKIDKLISTYGDSFLSNLDSRGYIHTVYTQTKTETGRLSSKEPNLQNIPKPPKGQPHKDIRRFFIANPGYKLITCDMTGAEISIAADYSGEDILLESLRLKDFDMHSALASISFSIIFDREFTVSKSEKPVEVDGFTYIPNDLRDTHKSVVFAKFYKGGAARVYGVLSEYINNHWAPGQRMDIASKISKALDEKMPKLSRYLSNMIRAAQKHGYLRSSKFGRIRFFDPEAVFGEAANYPIQGTNSEALKMAMCRLDPYMESIGGHLVLNTHDETVYEVPDEHAEEAAKTINEEMSYSLSYFLSTVKGSASVKISQHWEK